MRALVPLLAGTLLGQISACGDDPAEGPQDTDAGSETTSDTTDGTSTETGTGEDGETTSETTGVGKTTGGSGDKQDGDECHPLLGECAEGLGCYSLEFQDPFTCRDEGPAGHGEGCGNQLECADGTTCVGKAVLVGCMDDACCTIFCDIDNPMCAPEERCAPYFGGEPPPEGQENVGFCVRA